MKLRTEISDLGDGDVLLVGNADLNIGMDEQLEHDAMAAHAYKQAINDWHEKNGTGPDEDVYPGAAVGWITRRAAEILAGWMGDRG